LFCFEKTTVGLGTRVSNPMRYSDREPSFESAYLYFMIHDNTNSRFVKLRWTVIQRPAHLTAIPYPSNLYTHISNHTAPRHHVRIQRRLTSPGRSHLLPRHRPLQADYAMCRPTILPPNPRHIRLQEPNPRQEALESRLQMARNPNQQ